MATYAIMCKGRVKNINTKIAKKIRKLNNMYIIIVITWLQTNIFSRNSGIYPEKIKIRKRVNIYDILRKYNSENYNSTHPVFSVDVFTTMDECTLYLMYMWHGQLWKWHIFRVSVRTAQ